MQEIIVFLCGVILGAVVLGLGLALFGRKLENLTMKREAEKIADEKTVASRIGEPTIADEFSRKGRQTVGGRLNNVHELTLDEQEKFMNTLKKNARFVEHKSEYDTDRSNRRRFSKEPSVNIETREEAQEGE